jgi:Arc/MetJ-type ribon-helix-helix transcriptional regulator
MKRTTITLPEDLADLVAREAERRRFSVSKLIRVVLRETLVGTTEKSREIPWAAIVDDPEMVRGDAVERALEKGWARDIDRDRG